MTYNRELHGHFLDIFVRRAHVIGVAHNLACMSHYILYVCVCYEMPTCGTLCRHSLCCVCIFNTCL